jgi:hypothetical protein
VKDIAGIPFASGDGAEKTIKLSLGVLDTTRGLFKVSASYFLRYMSIHIYHQNLFV